MFVSIIFCKESINGEVIFMFMTKNVIIYPFFVFKLKMFELVLWPGPLRVYAICKCLTLQKSVYPRQGKIEEILNFFNLNTEEGINKYIFCHEHEYYFIIYTFLT